LARLIESSDPLAYTSNVFGLFYFKLDVEFLSSTPFVIHTVRLLDIIP